MKVLIGCEYSGRVRDAFIRRGHDAVSCDLFPTESPGPHYQGDMRDLLVFDWDLFIWFPDCTYLCSSGLHWNKRRPERAAKTEVALQFVREIDLLAQRIPKRAFENPIGCLSSKFRKPDQIIQPYEFGHDASKATCLWLTGLPLLQPTGHIPPRMIKGHPRWGNQTDSGQNNLAPSEDRWRERARTYEGIAEAMAQQWG